MSQVNGVNVIKLGHKQVVSLIRQGGNRLLMKVVTVTRKPETEEVIRRKGKVPIMTSVPIADPIKPVANLKYVCPVLNCPFKY